MKEDIDELFKMIKKECNDASDGSNGFITDTKHYYDTGSYMLNALLSGSFFKGFPGNKIVAFAGIQSAGKTQTALNILKNFVNANPGNKIIYFDSEGSVTTENVLAMNIDPKRDFQHTPVRSLEKFKSLMFKILKYIEVNREKITNNYFFVLDSLGGLSLESVVEDVLKDKNTSDAMRKAKFIKEIFSVLTPWLSVLQMPMIFNTHVYDTMSLYAAKELAGGRGLQYAASIILELVPSKYKFEDEVKGTIVTAKARKNRSTKQYQSVELLLHHETGMNKYYGLIDFAMDFGFFNKEGNRIKTNTGEILFRKAIEREPEKYFTEEVLKELDKYAVNHFSYGKEDLEIKVKNDEETINIENLKV